MIMLSPPCGTFSRARRNRRSSGPHPIRSRDWPWGFPWLSVVDAEKAQQSIKLAVEQTDIGKYWFFEHPEDVGLTESGELPASIWQLEEMLDLLKKSGASCCAIHQCAFGAETSKPTRLASNLPDTADFGCALPWFDEDGSYLGPLGICEHGWRPPLIGVTDGQFLTTAAAAYPSELCSYMALLFTSAIVPSSEPSPRPGVKVAQPAESVVPEVPQRHVQAHLSESRLEVQDKIVQHEEPHALIEISDEEKEDK